MIERSYYGRGKFLLSGEYLVLDGAKGLGVPLNLGQSLKVSSKKSFNPSLKWTSLDCHGNKWMESEFELWRFNFISERPINELDLKLQSILRQARRQNPHFLRDDEEVHAVSSLEFPIEWGLGSSSSILYNIAQWAYISPFELLKETFKGSGYDIACAQSSGPILYKKEGGSPSWSPVELDWNFKDNLYFIYSGSKKNSSEAITEFSKLSHMSRIRFKDEVSELTDAFITASSLKEFQSLMIKHESILSSCLGQESVNLKLFNDFDGAVKSLGAWGGDFMMVASDLHECDLKKYFNSKGYSVILNFNSLVADRKLDSRASYAGLIEQNNENFKSCSSLL